MILLIHDRNTEKVKLCIEDAILKKDVPVLSRRKEAQPVGCPHLELSLPTATAVPLAGAAPVALRDVPLIGFAS